MPSKKQKQDMVDYIVNNLRESGNNAEPINKELVSGIKSNYVLTENGIVLLMDRAYTQEAFNDLYLKARKSKYGNNIGVVFYKDNKTFFRSAMAGEEVNGIKSKRFKSTRDLSLKNYDNEQLRKIISLSLPEKSMADSRKNVQYFHPGSQKLEKCILSFNFSPVVFDYSHIDRDGRFGPEEKNSERLYIWNKAGKTEGALDLTNGYLVPGKKIPRPEGHFPEIKPATEQDMENYIRDYDSRQVNSSN